MSRKTCTVQVEPTPCKQDVHSDFVVSHLPEQHRANLVKAHSLGSHVIRSGGEEPEPLETALLVEEYRWFWKPEKVKFVLVAESHVYASEQEIAVKIVPWKLHNYAPSYPDGGPLNFAKIVYCPGYGMSEILDHPEQIESNPGTWQFINLFRKCLGYDTPSARSLEWKTRILNAAKKNGIWLLDASCHACAKGKKERLPANVVDRIVPMSWKRYVEPIIDELSIDPAHVWIVGKGVHDLIRGKYATGDNWVYQPNVRFPTSAKYKEKASREAKLQEAVLSSTERHLEQRSTLS